MNKAEQKYNTGEYMTVPIVNVEVIETKVIRKEDGSSTSLYCYRKRNGIRGSHLNGDAAVMQLVHIFSVKVIELGIFV